MDVLSFVPAFVFLDEFSLGKGHDIAYDIELLHSLK